MADANDHVDTVTMTSRTTLSRDEPQIQLVLGHDSSLLNVAFANRFIGLLQPM